METTLTDHSRWPRGMCREHISTVKLAGGFTHICLKVMNRRASWPDSAEACMERETQRQFGETHGQMCVLKESSMKVGTACQAFSAVAMEISKDCVTVTISVWLHDRSSCKPLDGNS